MCWSSLLYELNIMNGHSTTRRLLHARTLNWIWLVNSNQSHTPVLRGVRCHFSGCEETYAINDEVSALRDRSDEHFPKHIITFKWGRRKKFHQFLATQYNCTASGAISFPHKLASLSDWRILRSNVSSGSSSVRHELALFSFKTAGTFMVLAELLLLHFSIQL